MERGSIEATKKRPKTFVGVLGHVQHLEQEDGAAATLRQLGALVRTLDLWDDPVNLMSYVTFVFVTIFGYSKERATELMLRVHNEGRAIVSTGRREEMERDVQKLHEFGLWATLSRDE